MSLQLLRVGPRRRIFESADRGGGLADQFLCLCPAFVVGQHCPADQAQYEPAIAIFRIVLMIPRQALRQHGFGFYPPPAVGASFD